MKKYFLIAAVILFNANTFAQCNQYFKVKEGTNWTLSNYDAKGKLQGKTIQKVTEYTESSNGFVATFEVISEDKKGEQLTVGSSKMTCEDGVIYFDMSDMFPSEQMESMQDFDVSVDGTNLELPSDIKTGDRLKDSNVNMRISTGVMDINFRIDITERKVLGKETLNTPAGDFDCFKVSQKVTMKTMGTIEMKSIEWYAKDAGMVKSETYDKKDKLKTYTILTTYNY